MGNSSQNKIPLKKALFIILSSVVIVSGTSFVFLFYYSYMKDKQRVDPKYQVVAVAQTSSDAEGLKTGYLTELLDLSIDCPSNLYSFNSKEALKRLLSSPVIKEAEITKINPGTIWVNYSLRKPTAILGDYSNTMIDKEGNTFPIRPFYTPKRLPEIYLGSIDEGEFDDTAQETPFLWGMSLNGKRCKLAFALLDCVSASCQDTHVVLKSVDVSKAFVLSCGQRQIVVVLEESYEKEVEGRLVLFNQQRMLRLHVDNYEHQLKKYFVLRSYLQNSSHSVSANLQSAVFRDSITVIDLRLSDLAFIQPFNTTEDI